MSEPRDEPGMAHRPAAETTGQGDVREGPDVNAQIKRLSLACVALYGNDMRDPAIQISLAALADNLMFQRIYSYALRAALTMELSRVEAAIEKGF